MTRESIYKAQLLELGIYEPAFDPEIKTLATMERELTRAKKAWAATAPPGGKPSLMDPHYGIINALRKEILQHRAALGLTPQALRKLRGQAPTGPSEADQITQRLDAIVQRVSAYDPPAALPSAVSESDTFAHE